MIQIVQWRLEWIHNKFTIMPSTGLNNFVKLAVLYFKTQQMLIIIGLMSLRTQNCKC